MNRLHAFILVFIVTLSAVTHSYACNAPADTYTVGLTQNSEEDDPDDDPLNENPETSKHRVPPRPIMCTISRDGVAIPNLPSDDIILYEVYTTGGICIASCSTEQEFISFIYSLSGTVEIRIHVGGDCCSWLSGILAV